MFPKSGDFQISILTELYLCWTKLVNTTKLSPVGKRGRPQNEVGEAIVHTKLEGHGRIKIGGYNYYVQVDR